LRLTLLGRDRHELRHLIANAMKKHGRPDPNYTQIYGLAEYLEWEKLARIRKRPLASVILPRGVVENVIKDATRFLEGAEWHAERGIPWRRGYLLYGPPGTGKTSLVKSLAGALGLDLAIINLTASRLDDQSLSGLFAGAPARSILLIEDIDAAFAQRDRDDAGRGITFSGLLNAIDGVASQEGHLLFMTTNHIERLDPALIRPGRVDMRIPFGLLDQTLALRMLLGDMTN
jgi:chaperone BCS1